MAARAFPDIIALPLRETFWASPNHLIRGIVMFAAFEAGIDVRVVKIWAWGSFPIWIVLIVHVDRIRRSTTVLAQRDKFGRPNRCWKRSVVARV
jgi:hypothetical protein